MGYKNLWEKRFSGTGHLSYLPKKLYLFLAIYLYKYFFNTEGSILKIKNKLQKPPKKYIILNTALDSTLKFFSESQVIMESISCMLYPLFLKKFWDTF